MPGPRLPSFVEPMLAASGQPFDSDLHLFEIKWDGSRGLAFIDSDGYRLINRRKNDVTQRYPEFDFLAGLPPGTVLDGEIVVLDGGKPDFNLLQGREQTRLPRRIAAASKTTPATYVVFDLLYAGFRSTMQRPLVERRELLREMTSAAVHERWVMSEGTTGAGREFFTQAVARGLEGVMAKRLDSRYLAGKRSPAWVKIKRQQRLLCAVIGYLPSGEKDFRSLVLAAEENGELRFVGKVGSGIGEKVRAVLNRLLRAGHRERPVIPCRERAVWVQPGIYCWVSCMERTKQGELRAPVFEGLYEG